MSIHKRARKNGHVYRAVVTTKFGKQLTKTYKRKIDAQRWEEEMKQKLRSRKSFEYQGSSVSLKDFSQDWLKSYGGTSLKSATVSRYADLLKCQILPWLGSYKLTDLSGAIVEPWKIEISKKGKWSASTLNDAIALLKRVLNYACEIDYIEVNPIAKLKPFKKMHRDFRFLTRDEITKFMGAVICFLPAYYQLYMIALNTGMRLGEIVALKWDCVDLERKQITVKRNYEYRSASIVESTKTSKIRRVPINPALLDSLREAKLSSVSDLVVTGWKNYGRMADRTRKLCRKAGVTEVTFHDLRHTFASQFMMSGGDLYVLKKLLGHTTVAMTEKYSHLSPDHLKGATDILDFGAFHRPAKVLQLR